MSRRHRRRSRARRTTCTPAWRRAWSVDDALRIHARYVRWRATEAGAREMRLAMDKAPLLAARYAATIDCHASTGEIAAAISSGEAAAMDERDPIWCDPALGDLLAASAADYPAEPLRPDHLIDPTVGMLVFARPLPMDWQRPDAADVAERVAAITWSTPSPGTVLVRTWHRATPSTPYELRARYRDLMPGLIASGVFDSTPPAGSPPRLLQALTGLLRTSMVTDNPAPARTPGRAHQGRCTDREPRIHRLYLRHPDHGSAELHALRAERAGSRHTQPVRGHWVRGHWRNQWFPSIEEHRHIWVAGFPRGDFTKANFVGDRVLVAHQPRADGCAHRHR